MTIVLLLVLVLCVLYLALRVRALEGQVATLARIVDKPRRLDRTLRKEIAELEDELDHLRTFATSGVASPEDFNRADEIREKLDRRLRALAGTTRQSHPPVSEPPADPPSR